MKNVLVVCNHCHLLHSLVYVSIFGSGHNGLLYGYLGHPCPPLCSGTLLVVRRLACLKDSRSYTGGGLSPWQV